MFFVPLILIILSLSTILFIVIRKFSRLVLLDLDSIQEIKEHQKKDDLLRKWASEKEDEVHRKMMNVLGPFFAFLKGFQKTFRNYVWRVEQMVRKEAQHMRRERKAQQPKEDKEQKEQRKNELESLLLEGKTALDQGIYNDAEKKFIAAVKLDPKNTAAYEGLGDVYYHNNQGEEAGQTYGFLLQLDPRNEHACLQLARMAEDKHELDKAVDYYQQALLINDSVSTRFTKIYDLLMQLGQHQTAFEAATQAVQLEPDNPKYLDNLLEVSILLGNKKAAEEVYERLRMVNPENNKLPAFRERINELKS
ncbi:MAG: tetratricopeptide repeat protein [Candidatus Magasanikbacteria bacterium]|nr:tetratricopeptide repeat protein [Candidatus Magasanikbacteria bacterium]